MSKADYNASVGSGLSRIGVLRDASHFEKNCCRREDLKDITTLVNSEMIEHSKI